MKLAPLCCLLLIAACTERLSPYVEENANLVKVEGDKPVIFTEPPAKEGPPAPVRLGEALPQPKVPFVIKPTLVREPTTATQLTELREVRVNVEVEGVDPCELAIEFTAPEGNVYVRQETRLNASRYDRQHVEFALPVAGTLIASAQLVGTWHAHLFHEGVEISSLSFEVTR